MATTLLYTVTPVIVDLPAGTDPNGLAWFGRWSSGHWCHLGQADASWAGEQGVPLRRTNMSWGEYLRLLDEAHWYEDSETTVAGASTQNHSPGGDAPTEAGD